MKKERRTNKKTHSIRMENKPGSRDRDVFCLRFFIFISTFFFLSSFFVKCFPLPYASFGLCVGSNILGPHSSS